MKTYLGLIALALLVVVALLIYMVTYTVGSTELALVARFGKVTTVHDGRQPGQAGLKFKWPLIDGLTRYDGRIQQFEDIESQLTTKDQQQMLVTMFCHWRIADPVRFYAQIKSTDKAEARIREALVSVKSSVLSQYNMDQLINTDPAKMKLDEIEQKATRDLAAVVAEAYGVDVVDVGIKSLGLTETITKQVIEVMKKEREAQISAFRAAGRSRADKISSRANTASDAILDFARLKAENIRTQGYRESARLYQEYAEHPEFAMFLRSLESLREELTQQTVIFLDGSKVPGVNYFKEAPDLSDQ